MAPSMRASLYYAITRIDIAANGIICRATTWHGSITAAIAVLRSIIAGIFNAKHRVSRP